MSEKNISFDFDQAKVTTQQSLEMEDADASGQELEEESLCYKANKLTLEFAESSYFKNKLNNVLYYSEEASKNQAISREYYIKRNRSLRNKLKNENFNITSL